MADFLFLKNQEKVFPPRFQHLYKEGDQLRLSEHLAIYGLSGTYFLHEQENGDYICAIGACFYPGKTIPETLREILEGMFIETTIADLKRELAGQYILMIKKGGFLYFFSDIWQVRQIFYSKDLKIVGSSFSVLEDYLATGSGFLNEYKVFEYLAIQYVLYYPAWINKGTLHKEIFFLRPFEYIEVETGSGGVRIKSLCFQLDNRKETRLDHISGQLLETLRRVIENPGFRYEPVGLTLTGGYDSRLISSIAAPFYEKSEFRVGAAKEIPASLTDAAIAREVARRLKRPIRELTVGNDAREKFDFYTEGMSPAQNFTITPVIEDTGRYGVGFGGIFGTELFKPIPIYSDTGDFITKRIAQAREYLKADESMWQELEAAVREEIRLVEEHYILSEQDINQHIHILHLLNTGFFGSFMLTPYNINGLQVEPHGHFKVFELVIKMPLSFKPSSLLMSGGFLQKQVMAKVNYSAGKVNTTHKRPMLPVTVRTAPVYLFRYFLDKCRIYWHIFKNRFLNRFPNRFRIKKSSRSQQEQEEFEPVVCEIYHIPNGTEMNFKKRIEKRY